jgi:glutamyl-Q tRNA(Asp) synthetase
MKVVRFAPSPTGWLHLGHAYAANYAQRAADGGAFLLRMEDIETDRVRQEYVAAIFEDLEWLGLKWEQPVLYQSDRQPAYAAALQSLIDEEAVYRCFCSRKEVAASVSAPHGNAPVYNGRCRGLSPDEVSERVAQRRPFSWRLDGRKALGHLGDLNWWDRRRGIQRVGGLGDPVIARKDIPSSYHLSCVVDDAHQGVNLVTRGDDLFESTHVHRVLQELLRLPTPEYDHHPLVGDESAQRLSKRDASIAIRAYREDGLDPSQVLELAASRLIEG